jgi:anti-sigma-K factor RskA
MSPAEYIDSGILELYATGAATAEEKQEVERMAAAHPEVRQALDRVVADFEKYVGLHAIEPDPSFREKLMRSVSAQSEAAVISLKPSAGTWKPLALAASMALLLCLAFIAYLINASGKEKDGLNAQLEQIKTASDSLKISIAEVNRQLSASQQEIAFLRNPMTQSVVLNSVVDGHPMKAVVHWNMESKMVAIDPMTLPATAPGEMYVLWAIVDGNAVNEGGFALTDSAGMMMMKKPIPDAQAFAISLEKNENVPQHEGPIYVLGKPAVAAP